jgi:chloride channel protein, CIC family
MGGGLGALIGERLHIGDPGLWAMVGMGAIMGGTMRSPFTGVVFTLELTHDLNALPALFIGSVAALGFTVLMLKRSILTEKLARRGQHISREYSVDLYELMRVGDVMDRDIPTVPSTMSVRELSDRIARNEPAVSRRQAAFIVDAKGKLQGIITRGDLVRALENFPTDKVTVIEAGKTEPVLAFPDELLHDVIAKMLKHRVGRLPVVKRDEPETIVGYLGRGDILDARMRLHEEEEARSRGPLRNARIFQFDAPQKSA